MKMKRINLSQSVMIFVMAVLLSVCSVVSLHAAETEEPSLKKVRVGYLIYQGYQEGEGDAPKSGYGYEYLQQIAYYAGWEYEYVNGSFNELLEMLKNGEIDLMGDLSYTKERAKDINFAKEEQGREYYYLFVREDRTDINALDLSTLQGTKIGINKGSIQVGLFEKWCADHEVDCEIVLYENSEERYKDMNSGKLDGIISTTVAQKEIANYHWNAILKIGYSPYYLAVTKKKPELYRELNDAITRTLQSDWYYNEKVYLKYNGNTASVAAGLDGEDRKWLEQKKSIKIGYSNNELPYSDWDEKEGRMIGLLATFIEHMEERYEVSVTPVKYEGYTELSDALKAGEIDAIFPVYGSFWIAEQNHLMVTDPLMSGYLMIVYKDEYDKRTTSKIAVIGDSPMQQFYAKEHYPDAEIVFCQDMKDCLNAVAENRATCTLMCSDIYYAYRNELGELSGLSISNAGYEVPVSFATRRSDVQMYRFLKKGLASLADADIRETLISEEYINPEISVRQFLQKHVMLVVLVFGIIFLLIMIFFLHYIVTTKRTLRLLKDNDELNEKAYIDLATGLPNKNKCEELLSSHHAITKPTACFMLDLNDLKVVNDSLGHEMGDLMLLNFAKLLRKVVPIEYFVGRFGGDEFIVIAEGISGKEEAEQLLHQIKEMIIKYNGLRGDFQIRYACGYAFSGDHEAITLMDLLNEADQRMYDDKISIKGEARSRV